VDELPLIGLLRAPDPIRDDVLRTFGDQEEKATKFAVQWAWLHRRDKTLDQRTAAQRMGIPSPHLSNILNGKKHLPPHKINGFEWCCGNRAVSMTIERFRKIREEEQALVLAKAIVGAQRTAA
jgi:transcriptional regulator with XRE-family HTH domain